MALTAATQSLTPTPQMAVEVERLIQTESLAVLEVVVAQLVVQVAQETRLQLHLLRVITVAQVLTTQAVEVEVQVLSVAMVALRSGVMVVRVLLLALLVHQ
jgi:hypothetical protein